MSAQPEMPEPKAILARSGQDELELFYGEVLHLKSLQDLSGIDGDYIVAAPFLAAAHFGRRVSSREVQSAAPNAVLKISSTERINRRDFLARTRPRFAVSVSGFDLDDRVYSELVSTIVDEDILGGHGSNFVVPRSMRGSLAPWGPSAAEAVFAAILEVEQGAHWTFLFRVGGSTLVGASPEFHLVLDQAGNLSMNPMSGTVRVPDGPPGEGILRSFLGDEKARQELNMVLDEELKIMSALCADRPTVHGPYLRKMARLVHSEYVIRGHTDLQPSELLGRSLVAPTVLGSPLDSAFDVAARRDPSPRRFFGGVLAHVRSAVGGAREMDSAVLIRTLEVDDCGAFALPVGATITRDSSADSETEETRTKTLGILRALDASGEGSVIAAMERRWAERSQRHLGRHWLPSRPKAEVPPRGRAVVVDNGDAFTAMLAGLLRSIGFVVTTSEDPTETDVRFSDLLVLGPGPGDPTDRMTPRIEKARRWVRRALSGDFEVPVLAVCLSHQILGQELGLDVRRIYPNRQGQVVDAPVFSTRGRVAFYNSFALSGNPSTGADAWEVQRLVGTDEVIALRSEKVASIQFHPESVQSVDGPRILFCLLSDIGALGSPAGRGLAGHVLGDV